MADEIELKLELTPKAADDVEASGLLAGNPATAKQKSVYFDTPGQALSKAGFSLRIRRSGTRRIQTIKANGANVAGLFARSEWECPVKDDIPDIGDGTPIKTLLGDATDSLAPVFKVEVERRSWIIDEGISTIELVLDRGTVVAGDRRSPICEIELELKHGDPAALFALARRIGETAPIRLGVQTKAERGYRLTGSAAKMAKAEPVILDGEMTAMQAFPRIVQSCIRPFRLNETILLVDKNPEALHQARVALRRMRSAFSIFKPKMGGAGADLRARLRRLSSEFGDARNLDILFESARPGPLRDHITSAREAAYDRVDEVLSSACVRRLMLDLAESIAFDGWLRSSGNGADRNESARAFAVAVLDRFRGRVKKGGRKLASANDETRHGVRKDAKKLRYAAEFFADLFDRKRERRRFRRFLAKLEALQDRLGALNDLATAPAVLENIGLSDDPDAAKLLANGRKKDLLDAAADAYQHLIDTKRFW